MYGKKKYAEVILLDLNLDKIFHYHIPEPFRKEILCGSRVLVPFKNKKIMGCIVGFLVETSIPNVKDIEEILDTKPFLNTNLLELTRWISQYYLSSWRLILSYVLPKIKKRIDIDLDLPRRKIDSSFNAEDLKFLDQNNPLPFLFINRNLQSKIVFYDQCIKKTLEKDKQVIILTPTESHFLRLSRILGERYGNRLVFFPEKINQKDKYIQWLKIKNSMVDIVLGMRSTIFVPFDQLGLIIVDEEHNAAYKEERTPRYNARDVAIKRAKLEGIPIILNSETPSLESYYQASIGNYLKFDQNLKKEKGMESEKKSILIDMNQEKSKQKLISYELQESILKSLKKNRKIILFLNKRGFSSLVICNKCGFIYRCPDCNRNLSYHLELLNHPQLICHYCHKKIDLEKICPQCGSKNIKPQGIGTQRLESEIKKMFPRARIWRADQDIMEQKGIYNKFYKEMKEGKIDIFIGTYHLIKKINLQEVDLLGIVSADTLLNLPDYRSAEKNFQLLSEIISSVKENNQSLKIIIQTFYPEHYSIVALRDDNYSYFYQQEIITRKELNYPPFTHLIKIEIQGKEIKLIEENMKIIINYFNSLSQVKNIPLFQLLGAKNIQFYKFRNSYKTQLIIKVEELEKFNQYIKEDLKEIRQDFLWQGNKLSIDVDPLKLC